MTQSSGRSGPDGIVVSKIDERERERRGEERKEDKPQIEEERVCRMVCVERTEQPFHQFSERLQASQNQVPFLWTRLLLLLLPSL